MDVKCSPSLQASIESDCHTENVVMMTYLFVNVFLLPKTSVPGFRTQSPLSPASTWNATQEDTVTRPGGVTVAHAGIHG
jgi:hypothetical protein